MQLGSSCGQPGVFSHAMLMIASWVINLAFAEWIIRRRPRRRPRAVPVARSGQVAQAG